MKAAELLIKNMESLGVKQIWGVPGEENLDLLEAISKSNIEFIVTRNEQTAVFMAANYGRLTGKAGVAFATLGPGATNMMTGVAYAQLGGMPLIVITGQKPQNKSKQGQFQIIDAVAMMKPVTKYSTTIAHGVRIPYIVENAFRIAEEEKPGAVCLELAEDIAGEIIPEEYRITELKTQKRRRPTIDEKSLQNLIGEIEKAKSPIILIGSGANRKRITKHLTNFIEKYNIPFFTSQMGKGVVDERLPQYIGTAALTSGDYIHKALKKSDLIISVGYDNVEKPTDILGINGIPVIDINFMATNYDYVYSPYLDIVGDIGNVFWQLSEAEINYSNWNFDSIYSQNEENKKIITENLNLENGDPIMGPRKLAKDLREVLGDEDILALDNGLYKVWLARNYPAYTPNTVLLDNALASMGAGYATAGEAKRLNPDKKVVCVTGDGGLVMNLGDLETLVRMKLDLVIVILNNSSYGMIKWKQISAGFEDFGLDFGNPDFVKLAESFGSKGYRIDNKEEFKPLLEKVINEKGLQIIDLRFEYPKDGKIL